MGLFRELHSVIQEITANANQEREKLQTNNKPRQRRDMKYKKLKNDT